METTGKATGGIFDCETGKSIILPRFLMNCHVCGKSFSPLNVTLTPTDNCQYYPGTNVWCRVCQIIINEGTICEHSRKSGLVLVYDNYDQLLGYKHAKET